MRRALPLLLALGAVALLTFSRRASASSAPIYLPEVNEFELPQSAVARDDGPGLSWALPGFDAPPIDLPALPEIVFDEWGDAWPVSSYDGDPYFGGEFMPLSPDQQTTNLAAFLWTIRVAEGTAHADGYRTMFGGDLFDGFEDHPRVAHRFVNKAGQYLWTSAAGAYQFMAISPLPNGGFTRVNTWDRLREKLSLPDFSPQSQDTAAVELIREAGALDDVLAGRFATAINKTRGIWASLPGAGYEQPEQPLSRLQTVYVTAGGSLA